LQCDQTCAGKPFDQRGGLRPLTLGVNSQRDAPLENRARTPYRSTIGGAAFERDAAEPV
jgi:hypothetical protein